MQARRRAARVATAAVLAVLGAGLSGCGTFAQDYPPTGVDELTIPTPSPDPADFVATVDNPWLPLPPGQVHRFRVTDRGGAESRRTVTVLPDPVTVAGVRTTAVRSVVSRAGSPAGPATTDLYAQDRAGNVWWFGHTDPDPSRSWRAGERGAEAGLVMAADPRAGDGYRTALAPGVVEDLARVAEREGEEVDVEVTSRVDPAFVARETYRRGVGLVWRVDSTGRAEELDAET